MAESLTEQQYQAISLLAEGMQKMHVAEILGVTRHTITNWGKIPHFADELETAIYEVDKVKRTERIQKARDVAGKALTILFDRLEGNAESISTKDLKDIYKDMVAAMIQEQKATPIPPEKAQDPDEVDAEGELDYDNETFRTQLRKLLRESK